MWANNFLIPAFPGAPPFDNIAAAFTTRHLEAPRSATAPAAPSAPASGHDAAGIRRRACADLGLDLAAFTSGVQTHEKNIVRVTERERGRGSLDYYEGIPATDALVTDLPRAPIGVFTADCVPVFLYDLARPAVGIVHAGWRSTVRSITAGTVQKMIADFGADPGVLYAAIGPSIGQCCYEVGRDVFEQFSGAFGYADSLFRKTAPDKWHLDLWEANRRQLVDSGLRPEHIFIHRLCSACKSQKFFSARKLGPRSGRTLSLIALRP